MVQYRRFRLEPASALAAFLTATLLLQGCARAEWLELAPPKGHEPALVARDREECTAEAKPSARQLASAAGEGVTIHLVSPLVGMGAGALVGLAAVSGGSGTDGRTAVAVVVGGAAVGAAVGFVVGLVLGVKGPSERLASARRQVYDACLRARGYTTPRGDPQ
jgi:membrane associated rhomboid family serine protease